MERLFSPNTGYNPSANPSNLTFSNPIGTGNPVRAVSPSFNSSIYLQLGAFSNPQAGASELRGRPELSRLSNHRR
ncbi:MAG: hypothetical protein R2865_16245 [Deinococcales bacterium]